LMSLDVALGRLGRLSKGGGPVGMRRKGMRSTAESSTLTQLGSLLPEVAGAFPGP